MSARARLGICLAIVALLYVGHVSLKLIKIYRHPTWDARDEVGQFWSEFAFHYRFAKFFAEQPVSDWPRLSHDQTVEYPDTVNDWAEFTVAMEVPAGLSYRIAGKIVGPACLPAFHVWVVWYDCLVGSLALFAVLLLAREVWRSDLAGLAAAAFYATLYPSYGRTVKNLFLREDFALPLIVVALWLTVRLLQSRATAGNSMRHQVLPFAAALMWLAALASWHLTQFILAVFAAALAMRWIWGGLTADWRRVRWFVAVLLVGSFVVPVLRVKQFYLSPVMCVFIGLIAAQWIDGDRRKQLAIFFVSVVLLVVAGAFLRKTYGEYAHVYQLFLAKLRHGGIKPADPAMLTWEARSLWEGAFNTAPWWEWWHSLQWCGPLAVAAVWLSQRKDLKNHPANTAATARGIPLQVWVLFTLFLVPLSWMVVRYFTFLGFAAAVCAAGMVALGGRRLALVASLIALIALGWQIARLDFQPMERVQPEPSEYKPIIAVIETQPTNSVILAHITESPVFWAHTGRPIVMHPKFENQQIRDRYREMLAAIYGNEDAFYQFSRQYGADVFVYDISYLYRAIDSRRYKADQMEELAPDCAARLFAEHPDRLKWFQPIEKTDRFTVFRVR